MLVHEWTQDREVLAHVAQRLLERQPRIGGHDGRAELEGGTSRPMTPASVMASAPKICGSQNAEALGGHRVGGGHDVVDRPCLLYGFAHRDPSL